MVVGAFVDVVLRRFSERLADRSVDSLLDSRVKLKWRAARVGDILTGSVMRGAVENHLTWVNNWTSIVHFARMARPRSTRANTLELDFTAIPRRYSHRPQNAGVWGQQTWLSEEDILDDVHHYVLTGDPGAGKTTTVKRLITRLLEAPLGNTDVWGVPLLVVLRAHSDETSIPQIVLRELGLSAGVNELLRFDEDERESGQDRSQRDSDEGLRNYELLLAQHQVVASILDACGAVLFLDGLDEVHLEHRANMASSIARLAQQVTNAKIVVTCRSGDLRHLEGFSTAEICALSGEQISTVASSWLGDRSRIFMAQIQRSTAGELADRPLFLCQMLTLFENTETIPDQPSLLHRQMIRLVLQDWDQERALVRGSRYKNFDIDTKMAFLGALAYQITFGRRERHFDHHTLLQIYDSLCERFGLPAGEADQVINEIETHTGIIVESSTGIFEFSHSSIQEYLAADHLVRLPDEAVLPNLFRLNSPPLAVAAALSADPSRFLARLTTLLATADIATQGRSFVTRLLQERPRFGTSVDLGVGVLNVLFSYRDPDESVLLRLIEYPGVSKALADLIDSHYSIRGRADPNGPLLLRLREDQNVMSHVAFPYEGRISPRVSRRFLEVLSEASNESA